MTTSVLAFNCQRRDPLSENYHLGNGYRAYNPALMRFNCPDNLSPFGAGGINPYMYCAGDPVNRADPSGHISWQAGLSIGLGILGIIGAVFTGGASIAAAGSLSAALAGASTTSLIVGASALVADITGIASAATEQRNPRASARLGWVSFAAGILSMGIGLFSNARGWIKSDLKPHYTRMGRNTRNIGKLGDSPRDSSPVYFFIDDYRNESRLNIVAHSDYNPHMDGATLPIIINNIEKNFAGHKFADYLESIGIDFSNYAYARTIVCNSADGGVNSFAQGFSTRSGLLTKAFEGPVWTEGMLEISIRKWGKVNQLYPKHFNAETIDRFMQDSFRGISSKGVMRVVKEAPFSAYPRAFEPYPDPAFTSAYKLKSSR